MVKQKKRWVLVADGARARVFSKTYHKLEELQDFIGQNLSDTELTTDKPGRGFESANPTRHAYQPRTDWHDHQKTVLAKEICVTLEKANEIHEFEELIVVCPPKTLGTLRETLNPHILAKITAELPNDVTKFTEKEILDFLETKLA